MRHTLYDGIRENKLILICKLQVELYNDLFALTIDWMEWRSLQKRFITAENTQEGDTSSVYDIGSLKG